MLALLDQTNEPFVADEAEAVIARTAAEKLKAVAEAKQDIRVVVQDSPSVVVPLPARAVELIFRLLEAMGERVPISVIPHEAELTTQQAADYLNVSRPYLIALLDKGEIDHRMVGRHRRVRFAALLDYERKSRLRRKAAIEEMAAEARRLNLD
jgi:excisionase family DNA binding protein